MFFSACEKSDKSVEKPKVAEAMKEFEAATGNESGKIDVVKLIDEILNSLPEVVASVKDVEIKSTNIKSALQRFKMQAAHQQKPINKEHVKRVLNQALDMEIQREIMFQKAKELKIEAKDEDIEKIVNQLKSRHQSEEDFINEFSKRGLTIEMLKKEISRNVMVSKLIQNEIYDKVKINDQQALDFYKKNENAFKNPESVHAAHILIRAKQGMSDEEKKAAKEKIEDILKKTKSGEDFAELAKQYSEGPSASRGGDLNYIEKGQMVKEFEEVAFKLSAGEISGIVETQFGYHIIKVYDKKESGGMRPFDEVKKDIINSLIQSKARLKAKDYIEGLQKKADVKRFI